MGWGALLESRLGNPRRKSEEVDTKIKKIPLTFKCARLALIFA